MKFLGLIVLSVLLNAYICIAQNDETRIWYQNTDWVMIEVDSVGGTIDSLFLIGNVEQKQGDFYAFYDSTLVGQIAAHLYFHNDTNITTVFFRSGDTKYVSKGFKDSQFYEARWCSNGQLIREVARQDSMRIVNYYCNGNRKNEFTLVNSSVEGEYLWWYENGNPSIVGHFLNNEKNGEWINYGKSGEIITREQWKDGVLIK